MIPEPSVPFRASRCPAGVGAVVRDIAGRCDLQPRLRWRLFARALHRAGLAQPQPGQLCRSAAGAPVYRGAGGRWRLSLTHSHGLVATVAADRRPIGVDLERIRPRRFDRIAAFLDWPVRDPDADDFYRTWTLWEACFKARPERHRVLFGALLAAAHAQPRANALRSDGWSVDWWQPRPTHWGCLVIGPATPAPAR